MDGVPGRARRVVVTGGTGFVGSNLVRKLLHQGHEVHLLVRPGYADWRIRDLRDNLHLHLVALTDDEAVGRAMRLIRPDWVFHLAVSGAYSWQQDLQEMVNVNILSTINLVLASVAVGVEAFVNTGSSSEYGFTPFAPPEVERLEPNSYYAVTKAASTLFCRYSGQRETIHLPTLRLYSVYGPYEDPGRLIPTLISCGLRKVLPPLAAPGTARDFVHVDDVCEAYVLAAATRTSEGGAVYNVGTGVQSTLQQVVDVAREIMEIPEAPRWASMPNRMWDSDVWVADSRKLRALGWEPRLTFPEGLCRTVAWFRDAGTRFESYRDLVRVS